MAQNQGFRGITLLCTGTMDDGRREEGDYHSQPYFVQYGGTQLLYSNLSPLPRPLHCTALHIVKLSARDHLFRSSRLSRGTHAIRGKITYCTVRFVLSYRAVHRAAQAGFGCGLGRGRCTSMGRGSWDICFLGRRTARYGRWRPRRTVSDPAAASRAVYHVGAR